MLGADRSLPKGIMQSVGGQKSCFSCVLTQIQGKRCFPAWVSWSRVTLLMGGEVPDHVPSQLQAGRELQGPSLCLSIWVCIFKLGSDGGYEQVTGEDLVYHTSQRESSNIGPESDHFTSSQPNSCWKPPGRSPPPPMVGPGKMQ